MITKIISKNNLKASGIALCFAGMFALYYLLNFPPPKFADLRVDSFSMSKPPVLISGKYQSVDIVGENTFLSLCNECIGLECSIPAGVASLGKDNQIKVWKSKTCIFQIEAHGKTVYSYEEAINARTKGRNLVCAAGFLLIFIFIYMTASKIIDA